MRTLSLSVILMIGFLACRFVQQDTSFCKINGASLVNPPNPVTSSDLAELQRVNADWVALIPYGFSQSDQGSVTFDHSRQWWGEQTKGNGMLIRYAKENDLKVMVKPHVWVGGKGWCGEYDLKTEAQWQKWELDFSHYIIHHAKKADSLDVELFCIGTEYRIPARERPEFWRQLVYEVRKVYGGKLTYAANWDNYDKILWWDELDYIGIDAYFPLLKGDHPTVELIKEAWKPVKQKLKLFSEKWDKPILFTEYGFQSVDAATGNHWEVEKSLESVNFQLQADAYEATFQVLSNENWWVGGFFWKWHLALSSSDRHKTEWTPQNKPAEKVIAKWYAD